MKKRTAILRLFALTALIMVAVFLPAWHGAQAAATPKLELNYPQLPTGGTLTDATANLANYLYYAFMFSVAVAGVIGVISIVISGFQILVSAGNPTQVSDAKDRILGAVLGIILLMFSVILLRTINPDLVRQTSLSLGLHSGTLYYMGDVPVDPSHPDGHAYLPADEENPDTANDPAIDGYDKLFYYCIPDASGGGPTLMLWLYNQPYWQADMAANGAPNMTTISIPCGSSNNNPISFRTPGATIASFIQQPQTSGIYFYAKPNCQGIATCSNSSGSCAITESQAIPSFSSGDSLQPNTVQSMRIIDTRDEGVPNNVYRYAAILQEKADADGECGDPVLMPPITPESNIRDFCISKSDPTWPSTTSENSIDPLYVHVLTQVRTSLNPVPRNGVTFFSRDLFASLSDAEIANPANNDEYLYSGSIDQLILDHNSRPPLTNVIAAHEPYANECEPGDSTTDPTGGDYKGYRSCVDKIGQDGAYAIILYTKDSPANNHYCEVLTNAITWSPPVPSEPSIFNSSKQVYGIAIIPIE